MIDPKLKAQLDSLAKLRGMRSPDEVLASGRTVEIKTVETKPRPRKKPIQGELGDKWWDK